jgi:hypothetical protein
LSFTPPEGWIRLPVPLEFQRMNIVAGWSSVSQPLESGGVDNVNIMIEPFSGTLAAFRVWSERAFRDPNSGVVQAGAPRAVQLCNGSDGYELQSDEANPAIGLHHDVVITISNGFGFTATSTYRGERRPRATTRRTAQTKYHLHPYRRRGRIA